jgi:hypothetical protein
VSIKKKSKINLLLNTQPQGVVYCSSWLKNYGYSLSLQKRYKNSHWFESIGAGAMIRHSDQVDYLGGIYALQLQLGKTIHPAGKTALSIQGKSHYLELSTKRVQLFGNHNENLPHWFKKRDWGVSVNYKATRFLPAELGLVGIEHKNFNVKVSSPARAVMEYLYLASGSQPLMETFELMESLNNMRPALTQKLLETCTSVKVKRLFLFMADKARHDWLNYLDLGKIDLGSGKRSIVKDGVYVPRYQITIPRELSELV